MARTSFYIDSAKAIQKITVSENILTTSSLIISNIHYILSKRGQSKESEKFCLLLLKKFEILAFNGSHLTNGFISKFNDKEVAFNYFMAKEHNCDLIITRNIKDFKHSQIPVMTPAQYNRQ